MAQPFAIYFFMTIYSMDVATVRGIDQALNTLALLLSGPVYKGGVFTELWGEMVMYLLEHIDTMMPGQLRMAQWYVECHKMKRVLKRPTWA